MNLNATNTAVRHPNAPIPSESAILALVAEGDEYTLLRKASRLGNELALLLRGGKKAHPNVTRAVTVAAELELHLMAVQRCFLARQKQHNEPEPRPDVLSSNDLPTVIGSAASDTRYIKYLTEGGMGMSANVVGPLRVICGLRDKLAVIQDLWPELQDDEAVAERARPSRYEGLLQKLIASGDVSADILALKNSEEAFERIKEPAEQRFAKMTDCSW